MKLGLCRQLSRQSDGVLCAVCMEELPSAQKNSLRLACQCAVHYHCLQQYICSTLGDREKISSQGICCSFFSKKRSICKAHVVDTEGNCTPTFAIGPEDLEFLGKYADELPIDITDGLDRITVDMIDKLGRWLSSPRPVTCGSPVDPYLEVTTKPCPNPGCTNRQTHFHGRASYLPVSFYFANEGLDLLLYYVVLH